MATRKRSKATKKHPRDAIALLEADHAKVRGLLSQLEESTSRGVKKRTQLLAQIATEIRIHARVEEEVFYPAFREAGESNEDEKLFFEAAEEHGLVDVVLPALEESDPASELFSARAKVLKDLVEHHAEEEEEELFPRAREILSAERLQGLRTEIEERKAELGDKTLRPVPSKRRARGRAQRGAGSLLSRVSESAFE